MLVLKNVNKEFGDLKVIKDLSFEVKQHSVFGFIGKNGAGKTTTMKMILGFLKPSSGEIYVCGERVSYGNAKTNRHIGYLPDVPEFYGYMKPSEYLRLCGRISGIDNEVIKKRSEELLAMVGLDDVKRRIRGFSRGMKQRLGIAQALLNEPELLICDEPTSALDPIGRKEILDILLLAREKTTIVFSTHILTDVERICDTIGLLDGGELVIQGTVSDIKNSLRKDIIQVDLFDNRALEHIKAKLTALPFAREVIIKDNSIVIHLDNADMNGKLILEILVREDVPVVKFEIQEPSLENVFLEVVK